ncbi:MAG: MFS transporter [Clostridiales bacterium]|nr:MFS transporter [Clostridiales bacterium]
MRFSILKQKNFLILMLGKSISIIGTEMQNFALSLYVLKITGSATLFATVLTATIIPKLVLGPIAGVIADRLNRKKLIIYLDLLNGLTILFFVYLYSRNGSLKLTSIYILVAITSVVLTGIGFLVQVVTGVGNIALTTMLQREIPLHLMGRVNSVFEIGVMLAMPLGQIVFGVLFDKIPSWLCLIISSLILLTTILSLRKNLISQEDITNLNTNDNCTSDLK